MRLSDLVGLTADAAFVFGAGQRVLAANQAAEALVGMSIDDMVGRACDELISPHLPSEQSLCQTMDCPVYQALERGEPVPLGWLDWRQPDGRRIPIAGSVIAAPSGEMGGEVALVTIHVRREPATSASGQGPALRVRLLGPVALMAGDQSLPMPPRRRVIELLAYLAFAGPRGVERDRLAEDLWPDEPLDRSAPRLRVLLHGLRQLLASAGIDDPPLRRHGTVYVLDATPAIEIDVTEFERQARATLRSIAPEGLDGADAALALYRGDFAAGEEFGAWALPHHRRLRRLYHDLLAQVAVAAAARGEIERSVECCERALESDPLQEPFQAALITYYGYLGRRADAQRQYDEYRRILHAEVGTRPSPAVERVLREALQPDGPGHTAVVFQPA